MTTAQSKNTDKRWMLKHRLDRGVEKIRHVGSHKRSKSEAIIGQKNNIGGTLLIHAVEGLNDGGLFLH